jgi:hypothetical protein
MKQRARRGISISLGALAVGLVLASSPAQAAGSTVVVANTLTPADCGDIHVAQSTDLAATLSAATQGKVLLCPGTYNLPGGVVIGGANGLTVGQAVEGIQPTIMVDPSTTVGLEIRNSPNVRLDGLVFDARTNNQVLVVLQFAESAGEVRDTTLIGSTTTATGILAENIGGATRLKLAIKGSQIRGYQSFGVYTAGPVKLSVTSSLFDGADGRVDSRMAAGIVFDGNTDDVITPTGTVSKSTIRNHVIGVRVIDGSEVTISKNLLTENHEAVVIEGGRAHALSRDNRVVGNTMATCDTCIFIDDAAADPANFQLLNTRIANNVIQATTATDLAVDFRAFEPALTSVTGTVTGNTFNAFDANHAIFNNNGYAGIKVGKNFLEA